LKYLKNKQKKPSKALLMLVVSIISLQSNIARSEDCAPIVKAADQALAEQDKVINLKTRQIESYEKITLAQDTRIKKLEEDNSNILKSPTFYLVLGIVVGGALIQRSR